uniref:BED-type domain-containing protein n=2 Tax=Nothobranchius korthausae TaxID=1143690 RepID=A0A1A8G4X5_9TELE
MSAVWQYFSLKHEQDRLARCNTCHGEVSCGATDPGKCNTSNLIAHLKKHHTKLHEDLHKTTEAKKRYPGFKRQTLPETFAKHEKFQRCQKERCASKVARNNVGHVALFIFLLKSERLSATLAMHKFPVVEQNRGR